jgi:hypothetical protein
MLMTQKGDRVCLKLWKSLYGLTCAPRLWLKHLKKALPELGFQKNSYDKCLLFQPGMLLVCFVDDCGLAVDNPEKINWFVDELQKKGFQLEINEKFTVFLGVALDRNDERVHSHPSKWTHR